MSVASLFTVASSSFGAALATDTASNYNTAEFRAGNNQGTGFSGWTAISSEASGFRSNFIGSSDVGTSSWGFFANKGNTAQATRPLSGSPSTLGVGQGIRIQMDNGGVTANGNFLNGQTASGNGVVGLSLQNSSSSNIAEFYFVGGRTNYDLNINGTEVNSGGTRSGVAFRSTGLSLQFTLTTATTYLVRIFDALGTTPLGSDLIGSITNGTTIDRIRLFNSSPDYGSGDAGPRNDNVLFNNLQVVPEPSIIAAAIIGSGIMLRRRREIA